MSDQQPSIGTVAENVSSSMEDADKLVTAPAYAAGAASEVAGVEQLKRSHGDPSAPPADAKTARDAEIAADAARGDADTQ